MKIDILHENRGRIRFHVIQKSAMSCREADILQYYLSEIPGVTSVKVRHRTGNAAVEFTCKKEVILNAMESFFYDAVSVPELVFEKSKREESDRKKEQVVSDIAKNLVIGVLPMPVQLAYSAYGYYQQLNS